MYAKFIHDPLQYSSLNLSVLSDTTIFNMFDDLEGGMAG